MNSFRRNDLTYEELVERGKQKYEKADLTSKLDILNSMGRLDKEGTNLRELEQVLKERKPLIFTHIATTGLSKTEDEILQIGLLYAEYDKNRGEYVAGEKKNIILRVSKKAFLRAKESTYDIFGNSGFGKSVDEGGLGMSVSEYETGWGIRVDLARNLCNDFLKEHSDAVVMEFNERFDTAFFEKQGFYIKCDLDLQQIVPEYDYACLTDNRDAKEININSGKYSVENICENIGYKGFLYIPVDKCKSFLAIVNEIGDRENLLERGKIINDKAVYFRDTKLKEYEKEYGNMANIPVGKLAEIGIENFKIASDGLVPICENASDEKIKELAERFDEEIEKVDFEEISSLINCLDGEPVSDNTNIKTDVWNEETYEKFNLSENKELTKDGFYHTSTVCTGKETSGTGNLYSDKVGAKADVVVGDVQKVGEVSIPHISQAPEFRSPELQSIYKLMELQQATIERLTNTVERLEKKLEAVFDTRTVSKTVDKTEMDRLKNPMKAMPHNVIKDDLKGHQYVTENEIEEDEPELRFKGSD